MTRPTHAEKSSRALARGRAERAEREAILSRHPQLAQPWRHIQALRRAARILEAPSPLAEAIRMARGPLELAP